MPEWCECRLVLQYDILSVIYVNHVWIYLFILNKIPHSVFWSNGLNLFYIFFCFFFIAACVLCQFFSAVYDSIIIIFFFQGQRFQHFLYALWWNQHLRCHFVILKCMSGTLIIKASHAASRSYKFGRSKLMTAQSETLYDNWRALNGLNHKLFWKAPQL